MGEAIAWLIKLPFVLVIAVLIMMTVYLIPHSLRGSTLDYEKLDRGVHPSEAIGTG